MITVELLIETWCESCLAFSINMNIFAAGSPGGERNPHTVLINQRLKILRSYTEEKNIN